MIYDLRTKNKFGFTLIELLVAITIGIVVIGLGTAALNDFNENQKIITTAQEISSNLRLARNYAVTNQLPNMASGANRTAVTFNNGLMKIEALDAGNSGNIEMFSKDVTPNGIGVSSNPTTIRFSVTDGRSIGGTAFISVTGDDGRSKMINIDQSGLIYAK